jgi:hypothetical protein
VDGTASTVEGRKNTICSEGRHGVDLDTPPLNPELRAHATLAIYGFVAAFRALPTTASMASALGTAAVP